MFDYMESMEGKTNIPITDSKQLQEKVDRLSRLITYFIRGYLDINSNDHLLQFNQALQGIRDELKSYISNSKK